MRPLRLRGRARRPAGALRRAELDRHGAAGARVLLESNRIAIEVAPNGTHTLTFQSEERRGRTRLGHGPDLTAACLDAVAMLDDRSPEDVPTQALLLAALVTYDPAWPIRVLDTLYPEEHPVTLHARSEEGDDEDDEDDEEVVEGAFDDEPRRGRG